MSNTTNQSDVYIFPQGIPGFEEIHEFRIGYDKEQPLAQLISAKDENIGFVLMRPEIVFNDYVQEIKVDEESSAILGTIDFLDLEAWVILTLNHQDFTKTTANLCAPILLNPNQKLGLQCILNNDKYSAREFVFQAQASNAQEEGAVD